MMILYDVANSTRITEFDGWFSTDSEKKSRIEEDSWTVTLWNIGASRLLLVPVNWLDSYVSNYISENFVMFMSLAA